ncbi:FecR domain-containing protein [Chitinophaga sp. 212800010-3]|uniref:FecR family protein n=1 Tax=unclassified Chitinophaga TaxID=2619133 RepID=UPI002DEE1588|nr:FecR family protein [Chitinophaga sp. 212800010-3]
MDKNKLAILSKKYLAGLASEEEKALLLEWYNAYNEQELTAEIEAAGDEAEETLKARMYQRVAAVTQPAATKTVPLWRRHWKAAAAVLILIGTSTWYLWPHTTKPRPMAAKPAVITPGEDKATLTLADGSVLNLDSVSTGQLALQGMHVLKTSKGQIVYKDDHTTTTNGYNVLRTPRGGQFKVTLPDGTDVWLNATSSVSYPTSFAKSGRKVTVTGEAYFEVASDASSPFEVKVNNVDILVLGTHFNVNAYEDEKAIRTTLLEGAVLVRTSAAYGHLEPGQQASVAAGSNNIEWHKHIDVNNVIAWKNGYFSFENADIPSVMRQLARWYNIDVTYAGAIPEGDFTGEIGRSLTQEQLLKVLAQAGIRCKMEEGRKLVIYP